MMLFDDDEAREFIRERLFSRKWWVIPYLSQGASTIAGLIEERFYDGRRNQDFQIILGPFQMAFAHKRRMRADQLASLLVECSENAPDGYAEMMAQAAASGGQDILIVPTSTTRDGYVHVAEWMGAFQKWVGPEPSKPKSAS